LDPTANKAAIVFGALILVGSGILVVRGARELRRSPFALAIARLRGAWAPLLVAHTLLVGTSLLVGRAASALALAPGAGLRARAAAAGAAVLAGLVVQSVVMPGILTMSLAVARGEPVRFTDLGAGARRALPMFGALLGSTLVTLLAGALLVVPAAVVGSGVLFAQFFVIDQGLGPLAALRASLRASDGHKFRVFVVLVLGALLCAAGAVCFGLGYPLALTVSWVAYAALYVRITRTPGPRDLPLLDLREDRSGRALVQFLGALFGLAFGGLTYWTTVLPVLRGSAWSLRDTVIRGAAIVSAVFFVLALIAAALPWLLDRLENRSFVSFVGARHVRSQKSGFLTVISVLSICGVAISSCALSSVVSVMGGFSQDLKRKILGNNAQIVIDTTAQTPWGDYDEVLARVRAVPGVVAATPVAQGEVMVSSASNLAGVIVRGIDPDTIGGVIELPKNIEVGRFEYLKEPERLVRLPPDEVIGLGPGGEQYLKGAELPPLPDDIDPAVREAITTRPVRPGLIIGRELAKTLHVYIGDEVTLVSPLGDLGPMGVMPRTRKFRIAAIFFSGMYEYDATHVYATLEEAEDYFALGGKVSAVDVKVDDADVADRLAPLVTAAIQRPDLRVRDWREMNRNLFSALKLERFATFIILSIAIMVASFCIICTLLLMVTEKGKEIAILKALGASDGAIQRTFMTEGVIIGGIGTVFGVVTGLAVCTGLKWFGLRLDPDVYYIDRLPINVDPVDFMTVAIAALTICTLATIYPAKAASSLRPVDGLRYE